MTDNPLAQEETRTGQQRKAIEVYCRLLGEALNDAGFEMKAVLAVKEVDVPWTQELIKEVLFKPIMQSMTEKFSTTKLNTKEVNDVYRVLDRHISSNFGISIPFPSYEEEEARQFNAGRIDT